jgi:hypothetical protein
MSDPKSLPADRPTSESFLGELTYPRSSQPGLGVRGVRARSKLWTEVLVGPRCESNLGRVAKGSPNSLMAPIRATDSVVFRNEIRVHVFRKEADLLIHTAGSAFA